MPQNTRQSSVIDVRGQGLVWAEEEQLGFKLRNALESDMAVILFIERENNE